VSNKIVETITTLKPYTQKRLFIADNAI